MPLIIKVQQFLHVVFHHGNCGSLLVVLFHEKGLKSINLDKKFNVGVDRKTIQLKRIFDTQPIAIPVVSVESI